MKIETLHGTIQLPAFFPDATKGVVRTVDSRDLEQAKVEGLVMNTFHLIHSPIVNVSKQFSHGLHGFTNWNRPIISDSGGFSSDVTYSR